MFKSLKERMELKKLERATRIILMNKLQELLDKEKERQEKEIEMLSKLNAEFTDGSLNDVLGVISSFTSQIESNPNLDKELVSKIHADAHAERMAEMSRNA